MGYNYQSIVIELDIMTRLYGSHDDAIFKKLTEHSDPYVRHLLDKPERRAALREIIDGEGCVTYEPHHYGYAVEATCFALGERAGCVDTRDEQRAMELLGEVGCRHGLFMEVTSESWFLPLRDTPHYPLVSTLSPARCAAWRDALSAGLERIEARGVSGWEQEQGLDALRQIHGSCARAAEVTRHLITFLH